MRSEFPGRGYRPFLNVNLKILLSLNHGFTVRQNLWKSGVKLPKVGNKAGFFVQLQLITCWEIAVRKDWTKLCKLMRVLSGSLAAGGGGGPFFGGVFFLVSTFFLFSRIRETNFWPKIDSMTPNPENLMKISGYAHSSDDENSALSNINLVETVDGLTKTPAWYVILVNSVQKSYLCFKLAPLGRLLRNHATFSECNCRF